MVYRTWDGGGTDGKWSTAANWTGDVSPGPNDKIKFDFTSSKSCTLDVSDTVISITFMPEYSGTFSFAADTLMV